MSDLNKHIAGEAFHVGNCYIWATISYLDSPTNYRECLQPQNAISRLTGDDLIMLDSQANLPWLLTRLGCMSVLAVLAFLVIACCYLFFLKM